MIIFIPPALFLKWGKEIMGCASSRRSESSIREEYITNFGTFPEIHSEIWSLLAEHSTYLQQNRKIKPKHILWAFARLKVYSKESNLTTMAKTDENTKDSGRHYRDITWPLIAEVSSLCSIVIDENWVNRKNGAPPNAKTITVDGIDIRKPEEHPFHPGNYSYKFNNAGDRFELVLSYEGDIVSVEGPFRAGLNPDDKIFRSFTMLRLDEGETAEGDGLYRRNIPEVFTGDATAEDKRIANNRRARHENVNGRLKRFNCLSQKFTHDYEKLGWCFRAVAVTTQLEIDNGKKLFDPY